MSVRNDHELPRSQTDASDDADLGTDQGPFEGQELINGFWLLFRCWPSTRQRHMCSPCKTGKNCPLKLGGGGNWRAWSVQLSALAGVGEAQTDPDGLIDVFNLAAYADRNVQKLSSKTFKFRQVAGRHGLWARTSRYPAA